MTLFTDQVLKKKPKVITKCHIILTEQYMMFFFGFHRSICNIHKVSLV